MFQIRARVDRLVVLGAGAICGLLVGAWGHVLALVGGAAALVRLRGSPSVWRTDIESTHADGLDVLLNRCVFDPASLAR